MCDQPLPCRTLQGSVSACLPAHVCTRVCLTVVPEELALSPGQALRQSKTVNGFKNDRNMNNSKDFVDYI